MLILVQNLPLLSHFFSLSLPLCILLVRSFPLVQSLIFSLFHSQSLTLFNSFILSHSLAHSITPSLSYSSCRGASHTLSLPITLFSPLFFFIYSFSLSYSLFVSLFCAYLCWWYNGTFKTLDDLCLTTDLFTDLALTAQWRRTSWSHLMPRKSTQWRFIMTKRALNLRLLRLSIRSFREAVCLGPLCGREISPDLKWNLYIRYIGKKRDKLSVPWTDPVSTWLYIYRRQIRPKME